MLTELYFEHCSLIQATMLPVWEAGCCQEDNVPSCHLSFSVTVYIVFIFVLIEMVADINIAANCTLYPRESTIRQLKLSDTLFAAEHFIPYLRMISSLSNTH